MVHHWLVPGELSIDGLRIPTTAQITQNLTDGEQIRGAPIKARQYLHWSAYVDTEGSVMDGIAFTALAPMSGYDVWKTRLVPATMLTEPEDGNGTGVSVPLVSKLSTIDRYLIGLEELEPNYVLEYLDPKFISPCNFQSGLFIAFGAEYYYFGFREDHRHLAVVDSLGSIKGHLWLDDNYYGRFSHDGVALRIVKRGRDVFFQAKYDEVGHSGNRSGPIPDLFKALENVSTNLTVEPNDEAFVTVARISERNTSTLIGTILHTWGPKKDFFVESSFYNFEVKSDTVYYKLETEDMPVQLGDDVNLETAVRLGVLNVQDPSGEAIFRQKSGRLHFAAPYAFRIAGTHELRFVDENAFVHRNSYSQCWIITQRSDGSAMIQQKSSGRLFNAYESSGNDYSVVTRPRQNNDTERWIITQMSDGSAMIQQKSSGRFVNAHESSGNDFSVVTRSRQNDDAERWIITQMGDGSATIQQKSSGRFVDAYESGNDFSVITRPDQNEDGSFLRDKAPKLVTKPPGDSNFAFGTSCRLERSVIVPFASSAMTNPIRTVWGRKRRIYGNKIRIPSSLFRRRVSRGTELKCAFILIAKNDEDVTNAKLKMLDRIRKMFDSALRVASEDDLTSDSRLSGVVHVGGRLVSIQQKSSGRFVNAYESGNDFSVVTRPEQNDATEQWFIKQMGDGSAIIQQKSSG